MLFGSFKIKEKEEDDDEEEPSTEDIICGPPVKGKRERGREGEGKEGYT